MTIKAEAGHYRGQTHDCYGVHPVCNGIESMFAPWVHCQGVVRWYDCRSTYSEAIDAARQAAEAQGAA